MKGKLLLTLLLTLVVTTGCTGNADKTEGNETKELFSYTASAEDVSKWGPMVTPGGGEGSASLEDGVAVVKAAADGWGGVQSEKLTIDLSKDPMLLIQVKESVDGCNWGAKFLPADVQVEGQEWGLYLFEDNNFKHNNFAGTEISAKLGEDFKTIYGEKVEGHIWIMAAGGPECTVEISNVKILDQK